MALELATGRGWKNSEEGDRKSLDCLETVNRNMDVKHFTGDGSERSDKHGRENTNCLRKYSNHHEQTTGRNMDVKDIASEASEGNEEHVIGKL